MRAETKEVDRGLACQGEFGIHLGGYRNHLKFLCIILSNLDFRSVLCREIIYKVVIVSHKRMMA